MVGTADTLRAFLDKHPACALVEVIEAKGSTPRETGAWMLVGPDATFGTIGGGQLEWMAIDEARRMLCFFDEDSSSASGVVPPLRLPSAATSPPSGGRGRARTRRTWLLPLPPEGGEVAAEGRRSGGTTSHTITLPSTRRTRQEYEARHNGGAVLDVPLGPAIGQCCGGRVTLSIRPVDEELRNDLTSQARAEDAARPSALVFGAGHVGHALAAALALLPVRATVVETRAEALEGLADGVQGRLLPLPEEAVRTAAPGTAFVILTHDHALDFLLAAEALRREDAAYVGMIGSRTKRATFCRWFASEAGGTEAQFARLVCPIAGNTLRDKRPAVIAALAAAEITAALFAPARAASREEKPEG